MAEVHRSYASVTIEYRKYPSAIAWAMNKNFI